MQIGPIHFRTALLAAALLGACSCQTAQRPVSLLPPGSAPPLSATPAKTSKAAPVQAASPAQDASSAQKPVSAPTSPVPESQDSTQSAATDAVGELVAQAEKEYQAGLTEYHNGKSETAKQHFDKALNSLLESNFDVRSDRRLEEEFDRIVTGVNDLYPSASSTSIEAQDEGQQKSEPAPIDTTNEIAPAADAKTLAKAEAEVKHTHSDLPLMMTDQVAGYISYFSGRGRGVFVRALSRSGRYHDMIVSTLKQEGVPQDLIYLAQAESGFHPLAVSRAGARGIWQFMAARGRGYGLSRSQWVDDRQDPEKSTRAAARHLKDLYDQFGDWYLAMAAYNSGPGTVQAAVKRTGYADFWELYRRNVLPKETRNYVPIILAVTIMAKNPSQYGLDDVAMEKADQYETVNINYPVDLRLVADCTGASLAELQDLNPSLLRLTTPHDGGFALHLPAGTKDQYETAIAAIPASMRLSWRYHVVQDGDTLASLARSYHTTIKSIEDANHLDDSELPAKDGLVIPVAPGKHPDSEKATYAKRITRYKVHAGDTVETVAENFGVSPQMVRRWNGIHGSSLHGRKVLALHLPVSPAAHEEVASARSTRSSGTRATHVAAKSSAAETADATSAHDRAEKAKELAVIHHKVKTGETLYSIASFYKTTVAAIERDNHNVGVLHPGMILVVQTAR